MHGTKKLPADGFARLVLLFSLACPAIGSVAAAQPADLVVQHANVITLETNAPRVRGFAVARGKFVVVGADEAVAPFWRSCLIATSGNMATRWRRKDIAVEMTAIGARIVFARK